MTNGLKSEIFKAYDVRGIYPDEIDEDTAYKIGRAYASLRQEELPEKKLTMAVGSDTRLSSPALKKNLIAGLLESGVDVVDIGLVSTPTFYFVVAYYGYDGGIEVSASHNPKDYNGFKITRDKAIAMSKNSGLLAMKDKIINHRFSVLGGSGVLTEKKEILSNLINEQVKHFEIGKIKPFKIVIDAANSMGALDMAALFAKLPCRLVKINFELDGTFPSHQPDPLQEKNLELLKKEVIKNQADLGIAPDGDGDRYFFVDEKGDSLRQEILRGLMAQLALKENPGATVCYDIRPGRITRDLIEEADGRSVMTPVGHSLIKEIMIREKAVFGGESSGHYFYRLPYGTFEAPIILVGKFLEFLSVKNKPLSEVIKPYQKYFHSGEINFKVADPQEKIVQIEKIYQDAQTNKLDGITIEYPDWWFNLRISNTESLIRLNLEAKTKELMEEKTRELSQLIQN